MITLPDTNPSLLISPTIQYATLTIDLNATLQKFLSTWISILTILGDAPISLTSILQVSQYVNLSQYLFRSSDNHPNTYKDANPAPDNTPISKKKS